MKKLMAIACVFAIAGNVSANAAGNWKSRAYDATYSMTTASGAGTFRTASDGKGHALVESKIAGANSLSIIDAAAGVQYIISEFNGTKNAMKVPYDESKMGANTNDDIRTKKGATPLGSKVVAGHQAHGYRYSSDGTTSDVWIADDIDYMVASNSSGKSGNTSMTLQKFSANAPAASSFTLPAGVKIMDMSQYAH